MLTKAEFAAISQYESEDRKEYTLIPKLVHDWMLKTNSTQANAANFFQCPQYAISRALAKYYRQTGLKLTDRRFKK